VPTYVRQLRYLSYGLRAKLEAAGFDTSERILEAVRTPGQRTALARQLEVEPVVILKLAYRADLARVKGVGGVFADLLEEAGIKTVEDLARVDPDGLYSRLVKLNRQTMRAGRAPTHRAVKGWVAHARQLFSVVEDE